MCSNNQLKNIKIGNLINLKKLYCNNNQLIRLDNLGNLINLEVLYIKNNELKSLEGIEKLKKLKSFVFYNNNFSIKYENYLKTIKDTINIGCNRDAL